MKKPKKAPKGLKVKVIAKGKPLRIAVSVQSRYVQPILQLVKAMTTETDRKLTKLFSEDFAQEHLSAVRDSVGMDAKGTASQARILLNSMKRRYDQLFGKLAMGLSPGMVNGVNRNSSVSSAASVGEMPNLKDEGAKLTISLKKLDQPTLQIMKASSAASANMITSIPSRYIDGVSNAVFNSIATGNGLKDLIPFLEKQENSITNWARNTAMDQTRKTYNGLNAGRMKKIGIQKGEWIHSGGSQHPRELHEEFDGQIFDLSVGAPIGDDGGNVMPGEEPNCRCTFAPVIAFDDDKEDDAESDDAE